MREAGVVQVVVDVAVRPRHAAVSPADINVCAATLKQVRLRLAAPCKHIQARVPADHDGKWLMRKGHGCALAAGVASIAGAVNFAVAAEGDGGGRRRGRVGVGLEGGVDFGVVGVEVVHHHAVGLRPLVELVVGGFCHASSCFFTFSN